MNPEEKLQEVKSQIESVIEKVDSINTLDEKTYEIEYWTEKNANGIEFHGLDLVIGGDSFIELYHEPIEKEYKKEVEKIMRYVSGRFHFLSNDLSKIQNSMPDRHPPKE